MTTRPPIQKPWPRNAEQSRKQTIDLADDAITLLAEARTKLDAQRKKIDRRDHPALIGLDSAEAERAIADAMRYLADIKRLMTEAKIGID